MLTQDDGSPDGDRRKYLDTPKCSMWQPCDRDLFDFLKLNHKTRNVASIETSQILPGCRFPPRQELEDELQLRGRYFHEFTAFAKGADLVFFDPDNGLEINSVPKGHSGSSKYVCIDELRAVYDQGSSVLLYQHFCRKRRVPFIEDRVYAIGGATQAPCAWSFRTSHAVFLLFPRPELVDYFANRVKLISEKWGSQRWPGTHKPTFHTLCLPT
jgi:hypothetical protein